VQRQQLILIHKVRECKKRLIMACQQEPCPSLHDLIDHDKQSLVGLPRCYHTQDKAFRTVQHLSVPTAHLTRMCVCVCVQPAASAAAAAAAY